MPNITTADAEPKDIPLRYYSIFSSRSKMIITSRAGFGNNLRKKSCQSSGQKINKDDLVISSAPTPACRPELKLLHSAMSTGVADAVRITRVTDLKIKEPLQ